MSTISAFVLNLDQGELYRCRRESATSSMGMTSPSSVDLSQTDPDWQWKVFDSFEDIPGCFQLKERIKVKEEAPDHDHEKGPFEVTYSSDRWPDDEVTIKLYSRPLIQILQQYIPDDGDLKCLDKPTLGGRKLYFVLDCLRKHIIGANEDEQSATADQTADGKREHLHTRRSSFLKPRDGECHRDAFLDEAKLSVEDGEAKDLASSQSTGFDVPKYDLQLSIQDGIKSEAEAAVVLTDEEIGRRHLRHLVRFLEAEYKDTLVRVARMRVEKRVAWDMLWAFLPRGTKVVYYCHLSNEMLCGVVSDSYCSRWTLAVGLDIWNYNGTSYYRCSLRPQIGRYFGERSFSGLPVCPTEIMGIPKQLDERLLANGTMFYELAIRSSNRLMQYTGPMFREKPEGSVHKEKADGRVMIDLESFAMMNPDYPMGNARPPPVSASTVRTPSKPTMGYVGVTHRNLIFAPAVVYGFSFALKQWGTFSVSGFRDIIFDTKAFEELTMTQDMKNLVHNLVSQYVVTPYGGSLEPDREDPIAKKSEGCVFLCYGPPGSGKTLTAESIAEKLECPLWAPSVSELGTTPDELEKTLLKVLDVAAIWQAVLLLDEADVYLEKSTSGSNLVRNAMTGVFLRMLEYCRVKTFDEAFRSRVSVYMRYRQLSVDDRQKLWRILLRRGGMEGETDHLCSELATRNLNAREIRNAIRTAQVWAKSTGKPFEPTHVKYVIQLLADSLESLNQDLQSRNLDD